MTGSEELVRKSVQTRSGNNNTEQKMQTYQCLLNREWSATEKPKYSLSAVPLYTTADSVSTLKPQIPTDWSKQINVASSLFIFRLDSELEWRSAVELDRTHQYCVSILTLLDLKSSTQPPCLPGITLRLDVMSDR